MTDSSLSSIGSYAFQYSRLTQITIPNSLHTIGDYAFKFCGNLTHVDISMTDSSLSSISDYAFQFCNNLTQITIPNNVTNIGINPFTNCTSLTTINISNDIFSLDGSYCLIDISNDNIISYLIASPDTSYSIPDSVKTIGDNAFNHSNLTHITIPNNVQTIDSLAFAYCINLTTVDISMTDSSLTTISDYAFYGCNNLSHINIPNSVITIGVNAFFNCSNLTNVKFGLSCEDITFGNAAFNGVNPDISFWYPSSISGATLTGFQNKVIKDNNDLSYSNFRPYLSRSEILELSDSNLYYNTILNQNFYDWNKVTLTSLTVASTDISNLVLRFNEVILTSGITDICDNAFQNSTLTQITIPNSVTTIGNFAFNVCSNLTTLDISMTDSSLSSIGNYAFSSCNKLTQITIPNSVKNIGSYAFQDCNNLTQITIPNNVTNIGINPFTDSTSLTTINISNDIFSLDGSYCLIDISNDNIISYLIASPDTSYSIPNSVKTIGDYAFGSSNNLTHVDISMTDSSLSSIGSYAFQDSGLTQITIPNSLHTIGDYAFKFCNKLTHVDISMTDSSLSSISDYAFQFCNNLTQITIPNNVTNIGNNPFTDSTSLTTINISNDIFSLDGSYCLIDISNDNIISYLIASPDTSYSIPDSVKTIGVNAFNHSNLTHITIPNNVQTIDSLAFAFCTYLTTVDISITDSSLSTISDYAFYGCNNLSHINIPNSVITIGVNAFYDCSNLTNVIFGLSCEDISFGNAAFNGVNPDISFWYPSSISGATLTGFQNKVIKDNNDLSYSNFRPYITRSEILELSDSNLYYNTILNQNFYDWNKVQIHSSTVTYTDISNLPYDLNEVILTSGITDISSYAFQNSTLTQITIPNSVIRISDFAFQNCNRLTNVDISMTDSSLTIIGTAAFSSCNKLTQITIPNSVKNIGDNPFNYCTSLTTINISNDIFRLDGSRCLIDISNDNIISYLIASPDTSYSIPDTVITIGEFAFHNCISMNSITIPNSVIRISDFAFMYCGNLTSVIFGLSCEDISFGTDVFYNVNHDISFLYPSSISGETFKNKVIKDNIHLSYINFRPYITRSEILELSDYNLYYNTIDKDNFYDWKKITLTSLTVASTDISNLPFNLNEVILTSGITDIGSDAFQNPSLTQITIPNSVKNIGSEAFAYCNNLTHVNISMTDSSLNSIGECAFFYCNKLTQITIPNSVKNIGSEAFAYCTSLTLVDISMTDSSLSSIGSYAFYDCNKLTQITIPNSVKNIGSEAFAYCTSLTAVIFGLSCEDISFGTDVFYGVNPNISLLYPSSISGATLRTFQNSVLASTQSYFNNCDISYSNFRLYETRSEILELSGSNLYYNNIFNQNFYDWKNITLTSLTVTYTDISNLLYVFNEVILTYGITDICDYAFQNSTLTQITIPNNVINIGINPFNDCTSLTTINISNDIFSLDGSYCLIDISNDNIISYLIASPDTSYSIQDSVITIGVNAFNNSNLTRVDISMTGSSLISIGSYAFSNCVMLTQITIPNNVKNIGDNPFNYCTSLTTINISNDIFRLDGSRCLIDISNDNIISYLIASPDTSYSIPDSVKTIGNGAFNNSNLTHVDISMTDSSLSSIGSNAFFNCISMNSFSIPNNVINIGINPFTYCTSLTTINISNDIFSLDGSRCLIDNSNDNIISYLIASPDTSYSIPDSVKTIGNGAFQYSSNLTHITIPNSVTDISSYAFYDCNNLTNVIFGLSCEDISFGTDVFYGVNPDISFWYPSSISGDPLTRFQNSVIKDIDLSYSNFRPYLSRSEILELSDSNLYYNTILNQNFYEWKNITLTSLTVASTDISNLPSELNEVILTSGITDIGSNAFQKSSLTQITIPYSLQTIGIHAFFNCSKLRNVDISMTDSSLSTIGNYAFDDCVMLTHITIPNNVTNIGINPFTNCLKLTTINISNDIFSLDGSRCLIDNSNHNIISYLIASQDTSYSIQDSVKTIGSNAFHGSTYLTNVDISMTDSSLNSIGSYAFYNCISMNSITIPNSVTNIGSAAFNNCNNLTNVIFGLSCEDITFGTDVFYGVNHDISFWYPSSISGELFQTNVTSNNSDLSYSNFRPYITRSEILELSDYKLYYNTILNQNFYDWKNITLTSLTVASTDISNLPSELNEVILTSGITEIDYNAFKNSTLTQITIPNSVTYIQYYAFGNCSNLRNVDISMTGSSLSSIGSYAFQYCNDLSHITIPNNVINIGDNPFPNCSKLTTINISNDNFSLDGSYCLIDISNDNIISYLIASQDTSYSIPNSVITIGNYAFNGSNYLTHVDISMTDSSLSSIGSYAFSSCISMNSITIPNSVTNIGSAAFSDCGNLTAVIFGLSCEDIIFGTEVFNGVNPNISLLYPSSISGATFQTNVTFYNTNLTVSNFRPYLSRSEILELSGHYLYYNTILNQNFYDWKNITLTSLTVASTDISNLPYDLNEVILTSGITDIDYNAFQKSTLTHITIPNSVKNIGRYAFQYCNSLTNVDISMTGSSLSTISDYAFQYCNDLSQITIPNNVINIGINPFTNCSKLTTINISNDIFSLDGSYCLIDISNDNIISYLIASPDTSYSIPDTVITIGDFAFQNSTYLTNVDISMTGSSLSSIGNGAFYDCNDLSQITIPNNVQTIDSLAFAYCINLRNVDISMTDSSLSSIGSYAFYNCNDLSQITIPNNVTNIGINPFNYCTSLTTINISNDIFSLDGSRCLIDNSNDNIISYLIASPDTSYSIQDSVKTIGDNAFQNSTLTQITIPNSVTNIGVGAFNSCNNLTNVIFGLSCEDISFGTDVFYGVNPDISFWYPSSISGDPLRTFQTNVIQTSDLSYSNFRPYLSRSEILELSDSKLYYNTIDNHNFYEWKNITLTSSTVARTIIGSLLSELNEVILTSGITEIGSQAFQNSGLTQITIPNSVIRISDYAFERCTSLTFVDISMTDSSLSTIDSYAFYGCIDLSQITIPNNVINIGDNPFNNCTSLTTINISNDIFSLDGSRCLIDNRNHNIISYLIASPDTSYSIPDTVKTIGNGAFQNSTYLTNVHISMTDSSLNSIGEFAFYNCISMNSFSIPNSVINIHYNAFGNCSNLTSVIFGLSCEDITFGFDAFVGVNPNISLLYPSSISGDPLTRFQTNVTSNNSNLSYSNFHTYEMLEFTGTYLYYNTIDNHKIYDWNKVQIHSSTVTYTDISNLLYVFNEVILTSGITDICDNAFQNSTLTQITIPYSLQTIGIHAFFNCSKLRNVDISMTDSSLSSIGSEAFAYCNNLTQITIPNNVINIGDSAFYDCTKLAGVDISMTGSSLLRISPAAFKYCSSLTQITIPNDVSNISNYAFQGCSSLITVDISMTDSSLNNIGTSAFQGCSSLQQH